MRVLLIVIGILYTTSLSAQHSNESVRINQLFNFNWKYKWGEVTNAHQLTFDDSNWRTLDLPHDFQFEQPWDESASRGRGFKAMGVGWYRKTFQADPIWNGKRILLDFEGIMLTGDVWLNGKKIGGTDYGYLGFEADITDVIKYDTMNVVAVRASTNGGSRWYTGGGLFRDVHLVVKDTISIARNGIFITTPNVSDQHAEVNVQVEVEGIKNKQYELEIHTTIFSPEGKQIAETKALVPQKFRRETLEVPLPKVNISNPELWSCETPHLYSAEIALVLNGKMIDRLTERFGIRTIEFSKEFGLKLNGKKIFLKGVANHHDLGAVGAAAYETAIARMMDKIKSFGFNHIRTSHNPYSKAFMRIADEKGILIVDELYDKWSNTIAWAGREPWTEIWYKNLIEWIKRDRNHPSVIMWSFGNELQFQEERCGFPTNDWGVTTYRILDVLAKRYDPTRKTTVAMYPARAHGIVKHDPDFRIEENILPPELATVTEVTSFNYCWDDYQKYLKHAPDMIIYQSEAVTNELVAPYFGMDRDKMVGLAYWGAIEYWGESNSWPKKGWNYSFFNHSLEPYPQAYLMKSIFDDDLLVRIGIVDNDSDTLRWNDMVVGQNKISSHWNREVGKKYNIVTYTNADEVELLVNGKSLGVQQNTTDFKKRNIISWKDIPYTPGKITAIARKDGKIVAQDELQTTGKAVALKIEAENATWKADGMDLQYIKVYAIDNKGRKVPDANAEVTFDISGTARIIAVDNGDHLSNDLFDGNKKALHNGFAMAILRSQQTAGTVKLKVTATGLKGGEKTLTVVPTVAQTNDLSVVKAVARELAVVNAEAAYGNLTLPTRINGATVTWSSDNEKLVTSTGEVNRPENRDSKVVLRATITKGLATASKDITVRVVKTFKKAPDQAYLFVHFTFKDEKIYFSLSKGNNALDWREMNNGKPVFTSTIGTTGLRDPYIVRSPQGDTFYLMATDLKWFSEDKGLDRKRYIQIWESHDLVNWSAQRDVLVSPPNVQNTYAPEAVWDDSIGAYVVFWTSKLGSNTYHTPMYATTRDFVTFTEAQIWQPGQWRIDSTVKKVGDWYYRFTKLNDKNCNDIVMERAQNLRAILNQWETVDRCIGSKVGVNESEAPLTFHSNPGDVNGDYYYLWMERWIPDKTYVALRTKSFENPKWEVVPVNFPNPLPKHGAILPITAAEAKALTTAYPTTNK